MLLKVKKEEVDLKRNNNDEKNINIIFYIIFP